MTLSVEEAQRFLRAEFGIDVGEDDPILASFLIGQLALKSAEPEMRKLKDELVREALNPLLEVLKESGAAIAHVENMSLEANQMREEIKGLRASVDALNRELAEAKKKRGLFG